VMVFCNKIEACRAVENHLRRKHGRRLTAQQQQQQQEGEGEASDPVGNTPVQVCMCVCVHTLWVCCFGLVCG